MSLKIDKVQLEIIMKADSARAEMLKLDDEAKRIQKSMKGLKKDSEEYIRKNEELSKVKLKMQELRNQIGLTGMTMRELQQRSKELQLQLRNLDPRSPRYAEYRAELDRINNRMRELRGGAQQTETSLSRLANGFNKYFAIGAAAVASVTGLSMTFRKLAEDVAHMDDVYSDVMKTTGMTRDQVLALNEDLKKIDTRTGREELNKLASEAGKIGRSSKKDILDFVDAGNQIRVALGEDLGEDAIKNIGKMVGVFQSSTDQLKGIGLKEQMLAVGSAVNELGASSTASEPYLVSFAGRMGGISKQAKISMADILGYASALDQDMQQVEMSATALQTFIMKLMGDPAKFAKLAGLEVREFTNLLNTDTNAAMKEILRTLNDKGGFQALIPIFQEMGLDGARATGVLSAMAGSIDKIDEAQKIANQSMSDGISITNEYNIKNNNLAAQLEKAKKRFQEQALQLGQSLNPILLKSTNATSYLIKALVELPKWINENKITIGALVAIWGIYTVGVYASIIADKLKVIWTDKITVSFGKLTAAIKKNPWAFIATGVIVGITWLNKYLNKQKEVNKEQEEFNKLAQRSKEVFENTKSLEQRASVMKSLSKDQLESFKSDLEMQLAEQDKFDAEIKTKAQLALSSDKELSNLRQKMSKAETSAEMANLSRRVELREEAILKELGAEFEKNNKSKDALRQYLADVEILLKKKNKDADAPYVDPDKAQQEREKKLKESFDKELSLLDDSNKKWQLKLVELRRTEKISQDIFDDESLNSQLNFLNKKRIIYEKYGESTVDIELEISNLKKNIAKTSDDVILDLTKTNQENGLKAIESGEKNKQSMLDDAYAGQLISQRNYNIESKKLTRDGIEARLAISEATLKSLMSAEFQSEETRKKAIENQKAEIEKLKEELRKAGIDLKGLLVEDAVDVGEQMQKIFGSAFSSVGDLFTNFTTSLNALKQNDLKSWEDWGMAIGGIVQSSLAVASQINDQYFEYKANALEADKQRELTAAGTSSIERERIEREYAQKELDLKKKQSSSDSVLKGAQVLTAGSLAVMQAFAQLGPIGGAIAAVLIGTMTGLQIAAIAKQNAAIQATTLDSSFTGGSASSTQSTGTRVAQAADGRYDVVGAQDNQLYRNVQYGGNARTGLVTKPTLYGERGTELVIDAPTLSRLNMKVPNFNSFVLANRVNQRADGNYTPANKTNSMANPGNGVTLAMLAALQKNNELLEYLKIHGIEAFMLYDKVQREQRIYEESIKKGSK